MKNEKFVGLKKGTGLLLKADRAAAYDIAPLQPLFFYNIQERKGYSVPWIVALGPGGLGHFKPRDFRGFSGTNCFE